MKFTVAIDGPAASGKGTIARAIAEKFGFAHLDTGLLYRAVGRRTMDQGRGVVDEGVAILVAKELRPEDLKRPDLRGSLASKAASRVAAIPEVREALLKFQRDFAAQEGGAVLDGRDIGTVICPKAEVKLFVTATEETRAQRRHAELTAKGEKRTLEMVLFDLKARDARDAGRDTAPLAAAEDALLLDTTEMSIEEATAAAFAAVQEKLRD